MECKYKSKIKWIPLAMGWVTLIITLGGIASLQSLCWTRGIAGTNSRKLLQDESTYPVLESLFASCGKTYRFQWWGWALQVAYLSVVTGLTVWKETKAQGIHLVGTVSTVLSIILANDTLKVEWGFVSEVPV